MGLNRNKWKGGAVARWRVLSFIGFLTAALVCHADQFKVDDIQIPSDGSSTMKIGDTYFQTDGSSTLQMENAPDHIEGLPGAIGEDTILKYDNSPAIQFEIPGVDGAGGATRGDGAAD